MTKRRSEAEEPVQVPEPASMPAESEPIAAQAEALEVLHLCPHCHSPIPATAEQAGKCPMCGGAFIAPLPAGMQMDLFGEPHIIGGEKYWTAAELAQAAGLANSSRIRHLCQVGRLPGAFLVSPRLWLVPDTAARVWLSHDRDRRYKRWRKPPE